jgi:hypothetical protein
MDNTRLLHTTEPSPGPLGARLDVGSEPTVPLQNVILALTLR